MAGDMGSRAPLAFACGCGALKGEITPAGVRHGTHADCFCPDCRANELAHGQPDPAPGPVDIFQIAAHHVHFTEGLEHLSLLRLSPKGLLRWYAGCCGTPMINTLAKPGISFAGILTARLAEPERLGPVRGHGFVPQPDGKVKTEGLVPVLLGLASRALAARITGKWRDNPFFDASGAPIVAARVLGKEERAAFYPASPAP